MSHRQPDNEVVFMPWKKVPKANEELLEKALAKVPGAVERRMFGCPAYFINGYMFAGAHQDDIILRLSESDQDEMLSKEGAAPFMPMPGRIMREYVVVPPSIYQSESEFLKWLNKSRDYAMSLPPKVKKPKKSAR